MRIYLSYILTGLVTFWVVLFLFGLSAGFAHYAPIIALTGSVLLFAVASPILILRKRLGLIIGIVSCLLIVPFDIGFTISLFDDGVFNWGTLLGFIPIVLIGLSLFFTIKDFSTNHQNFTNRKVKILLFIIPILLLILYVIFYGRYWSWQMFKL